MTIDRPCRTLASANRVRRLLEQWERQWNNEHASRLPCRASSAAGVARNDASRATVEDFWERGARTTRRSRAGASANFFRIATHLLAIRPVWNGRWPLLAPRPRSRRSATTAVEVCSRSPRRWQNQDSSHIGHVGPSGAPGAMLVMILVPSTPLMRSGPTRLGLWA